MKGKAVKDDGSIMVWGGFLSIDGESGQSYRNGLVMI